MSEESPRFEQTFTITSTQSGKVRLKIVDRITVDDVFIHMVNRELFRLVTGEDIDTVVPQNFKDALLKTRYTAG